MKQLLAGFLVISVVAGALALSRSTPAGGGGGTPDLQIKQEAVNPWTNLKLNNDPKTFRFAILSDNTGGPRDGVFEKALALMNIMQPEFIVSIGDIIVGNTENVEVIDKRWAEFNRWVAKLEMPLFFIPGNNDIENTVMEKRWQELHGRRWYHFKYKDVLFLLLNTEDLPGKQSSGQIAPEQAAQAKKVLEESPDVRWTLVFVHRPLWHSNNTAKVGWAAIEDALKGRRYTVFAGHEHKYLRETRNGMLYYTLATTGGRSQLRGPSFGEFDHIVWVTMKQDGPVLANLMLDGILPEDVRKK